MPMLFHRDGDETVVAMHGIEIIGMRNGDDENNIKMTSSPLIAWSPQILELSATSVSLASLASSACSPYCAETHPQHQDCTWSWSSNNENEAVEVLFAMLASERSFHVNTHRTRREFSNRVNQTSGHSINNDPDLVNDHDRTKMCDWYYEMSDFLKIERATASRSLALLDRFMATPIDPAESVSRTLPSFQTEENITVTEAVVAASKHRDVYQLVALTALFLAIKLFERLSIEPSHVSYLSRGRYTAQEVIKMESIILRALEWKVSSAGKVDYVNAFLDVIFPEETKTSDERKPPADCSNLSANHRHVLRTTFKDLADVQIQLSDYDSTLSCLKPSILAFAAVNNAFNFKKDEISVDEQHIILERLQGLLNKMYHGRTTGNAKYEDLTRTMERLRVLVDPTILSRSIDYSRFSTPPIKTTPTSFSSSQTCSEFSSASSATQQEHYDLASPLDVALESIENFDMTQLFCCGNAHQMDYSFQNPVCESNGVVLAYNKAHATNDPSPTSTARLGQRMF